MDPVSAVSILAGIVAVLGFVYIVIFGQKSIPDWLEERRKKRAANAYVSTTDSQSHKEVFHNLPHSDYTEFIGREDAFKKVLELLAPESRHFLIVIQGFSGVGKTALALVVANHFLDPRELANVHERFDAIIWTSAKRQTLTAQGVRSRARDQFSLDDLFTTIAIVLQRDDITRARPEEQHEVVRTVLTKQRTLLIVDSLDTIDDPLVFEFLRELPPPTKAIVTSRQRIDISYPIQLGPMDALDATALIDQLCSEKSVTLNSSQKRLLFEKTNGVPIAIVWSVARMAFGYSVDATIMRLTSRQFDHDLVQFCFAGVIDLVRDKDEFNVLLALSLFESSASLEALGFVTELEQPEGRVETALVHLATLSLVIPLAEDRVDTLNLTRTFAGIELERSSFSSGYKHRLVKYYEQHTKKFGGFSPDVASLLFELDNIKQATNIAAQQNLWESYTQLVINISRFLYVQGLYQLAQELWDQLITSDLLAKQPDLRVEAAKVFALGGVMYAYLRNERGRTSLRFLEESLPILQETKDHDTLSLVTQRLGIISRELADGDFSSAEEYLEQARKYAGLIPESREATRLRRLGDALNGLGAVAILTGDYGSARSLLTEADTLFQKLNDTSTRSSVIRHQAEIARLEQRFKEASELCLAAMQLARDADRKDRLADAFSEMALVEIARGRKKQASEWADRAIETYISIGAHLDAKKVEALKEDFGIE